MVVVGSKAEGLTAPLENDFDGMEVLQAVICKDNLMSLRHEEEVHKFLLDMNNSCPGYTLLQAIYICSSLPSNDLYYDTMMCLGPGIFYLSSDFFKNNIKQSRIEESHLPGSQGYVNVDNETHGPSIATYFLSFPKDCVPALTCQCSRYLTAWIYRKRRYQWPQNKVIKEISSLESHVVPVGPTTSSIRYLEWRICFTKGEIRLVHSLNDCLTKALYVFKQIAKVTLKPLSKDISSYVVKNIVFWLAELNDYNFFSEHNLILTLKLGLSYLKYSVLANNLPNYMIPERNLFVGKFTNQQRSKLCMRIDSLLQEGPSMVLKFTKVRYVRSFSRIELRSFSEKLHQAQIIFHLHDYTINHRLEPGFTFVEAVRCMLSDDITRFLFKKLLLIQGMTHDDSEEILLKQDNLISNDPDGYLHLCLESDLSNLLPYLS